jgi:multicomponent Na+:H+ antiporter subunit G
MTIIGEILMLIGGIFLFLGSLGLVRMPDVYNRLQTGTKASTLGAMSIGLSAIFLLPGAAGKAVLLVIFIVLANPIASNTIGRSAYLSGIRLSEKSVSDAWGAQEGNNGEMIEGGAVEASGSGSAPTPSDKKGA